MNEACDQNISYEIIRENIVHEMSDLCASTCSNRTDDAMKFYADSVSDFFTHILLD